MPRRGRRGSDSSVDTVDDSTVVWQPESSVLKPGDPSIQNGFWELFELRNAFVLNKDGQTLENALHVAVRGPFIVRGYLIIEEKNQKKHLIKDIRSRTPIEIRNVTLYSIGQAEEDGRAVIWVLGQGGWFEINPANSYRPIFNNMSQATLFYYGMFDCVQQEFSEFKSKSAKVREADTDETVADYFFQYASSIGDGSTLKDVQDRCHDHAIFFITQFLQDKEIAWEETHFFKWLTPQHTTLFNKINKAVNNSKKIKPSPARNSLSLPLRESRASTRNSRSVEAVDLTGSLLSTRSNRSRSALQQPNTTLTTRVEPAQPDAPDDLAFRSVIDAWQETFQAQLAKGKGLTSSALLNQVYTKFKIPTCKEFPGSHKLPVEDIFHYNAKKLLQRLDKDDYRDAKHTAYAWLEDLAKTEFSPRWLKPSDFPYTLVQRGHRSYTTRGPAPSSPAAAGGNTSDNGTEDLPISGKGLKGTKKRRSRKSGLRLATTSKKRTHSAMEDGSESDGPSEKRSHYFSEGDETMEDADSRDERSTTSQGRLDSPAVPEEPIKILIRADKVPSSEPRGPDGAWVCDQDQCDYVVRGPDEAECQTRIREHFSQHTAQSERMNLAMTEGVRGHNPINHLLEKLKQLGERAEANGRNSDNGTTPPQPIKRKLLV